MSRTIKAFATALAGISLLAVAVAAQNSIAPPPSPPAATDPAASDQDLREMRELAEESLRLKAETEAALQALGEKERGLESLSKDVKGARQFAEDMIQLLRAAAVRLAPESAYSKMLQDQEDLTRSLAREALTSQNPGDHPYGDHLNVQASVIAALRAEARDLAAKLTAQVDRLERSKSQIAYAYAIRKNEEFIALARSYLDRAREVLTRTSDLASRAERIVAPVTPTQ